MNELRDPHEPVIPGQHEHPAEGHGGVSMPIGVSGDGQAEQYGGVSGAGQHVEDTPPLDEQLAETADADSGTEAKDDAQA